MVLDEPGWIYGESCLLRSTRICTGLCFLGREPNEAGKDNDRPRFRGARGGDEMFSETAVSMSMSISISIFMLEEEDRLRGSEVSSEDEGMLISGEALNIGWSVDDCACHPADGDVVSPCCQVVSNVEVVGVGYGVDDEAGLSHDWTQEDGSTAEVVR